MKKYLYIAIAAATLASCSQDEVMEVAQKEAISFGEAFVGNATRSAATDPSYTASTLKTIKVWGAVTGTQGAVEVFADNTVTGTVGEEEVWNCTDRTQYWIPNAKYNFAAVVDGTVTDLGTDLLPATISYTASTQKDLLYSKSAEYTGKTTGNDLVKFDFAHLLSKVKFTAVNSTTDTKYTFDITGLTITNSATSGTVAVPAKTWTVATGDGSDTPTVFGAIEGVTYQTTPAEGQTATVYECETEKFLIPEDFTTTKLNITFNLVWKYNGKEVATESNLGGSVAVNLQPGNAYNFVISKGLNTPIQFTVETLPTWTIQSNQNVTVQ